MYNESVELWQDAKISETSNVSEEVIYDKYQDAYEHYVKLYDLISDAEEGADFLQHKATQKELLAKKSYYIGVVIGVLGIISGIVVALIF